MLRYFVLPTAVHRNSLFRSILLLLVLLSLVEISQAAIPDQREQLLQFTAAGHVLGFESDGYYVASGDHMLHVGFIGTDGVAPKAANTVESRVGKAIPLSQVSYTDLWSGINLYYEATGEGITMSTWEIAAGADVNQIRLSYNAPVEITTDGGLKMRYQTGWMYESKPIAWQEIGGRNHPVEVAFHLFEASGRDSVIGFELGHYNTDHPLLIDPDLTWNTFLGGGLDDSGSGIAVDENGNVYVVGSSDATWGTPVNTHKGMKDAFVAKLGVNGNRIWNTFMGGTSNDAANGIAVDANGNVYVTGRSDGTWGGRDAFVVKLNANGVRIWYRFLGSEGSDSGRAITMDRNNNIYVVGVSDATWGTPVKTHRGNNDAFVAKLNRNGVLIWNTFMGGTSNDFGLGIEVDEIGNVYVAGLSDTSWGTPVNTHKGMKDAFAAKLGVNGSRIWNTFMGGASNDYGISIAVDDDGNSYVGGRSGASWGMPVNAYMGGDDVFATKLDADGYRLWNTFMGSKNHDLGGHITLDDDGNSYVGGDSNGTWGKPINSYRGSSDAFAAQLNSEGVLIWNLFMGSEHNDYGSPNTVDNSGNVYVTGNSTASWGSPVNGHAGGTDVFVTKPRTTRCTLIIFKKRNGKSIPICL